MYYTLDRDSLTNMSWSRTKKPCTWNRRQIMQWDLDAVRLAAEVNGLSCKPPEILHSLK